MSSEIGDIIGYATVAVSLVVLILFMIPAVISCTIMAEREWREWKQGKMELRKQKLRQKEAERLSNKERIKKFK